MCSPWAWAGLTDLLLRNTKWQKWWEVISEIRLQKPVSSIPGALSHSLLHCLLWEKPSATLRGRPVQGPCEWAWRRPSEAWQQPRQWAWEQAHPPSSPVMTIPLGRCLGHSLVGDSEPEAPNWAAPRFLTFRNCETIDVCCFQPLRLSAICYTATDN